MDKRCKVEACKREAETYCYHCSQDVCSKHFLEHKKSIQEQLPSFVDEVNLMYDRLRQTGDKNPTFVPQSLTVNYNQLEQWRVDCHRQIDHVYDKFRQQIDQIIENHRTEETLKTGKVLESLQKMREQVKEMLKDDDITHRQLETLKKQLEEIKQKEQEPIHYPDIHLTTQKIDVKNLINIVTETKPPNAELQRLKSNISRARERIRAIQQQSLESSTSTAEISKCPVCFMVFPSSMDAQGREQHVNEHYSD